MAFVTSVMNLQHLLVCLGSMLQFGFKLSVSFWVVHQFCIIFLQHVCGSLRFAKSLSMCLLLPSAYFLGMCLISFCPLLLFSPCLSWESLQFMLLFCKPFNAFVHFLTLIYPAFNFFVGLSPRKFVLCQGILFVLLPCTCSLSILTYGHSLEVQHLFLRLCVWSLFQFVFHTSLVVHLGLLLWSPSSFQQCGRLMPLLCPYGSLLRGVKLHYQAASQLHFVSPLAQCFSYLCIVFSTHAIRALWFLAPWNCCPCCAGDKWNYVFFADVQVISPRNAYQKFCPSEYQMNQTLLCNVVSRIPGPRHAKEVTTCSKPTVWYCIFTAATRCSLKPSNTESYGEYSMKIHCKVNGSGSPHTWPQVMQSDCGVVWRNPLWRSWFQLAKSAKLLLHTKTKELWAGSLQIWWVLLQ